MNKTEIRGVILAAGRGSRLAPLTDDRPKCMVPIAGKPLLHHQFDALSAAGVSPIAVVRGYMKDSVTAPGAHYFENPRWAESNMVVSLQAASEWLSAATCIISYSDIVYNDKTAHTLVRAPGDIVIVYDVNWRQLWESRFENPLEDAETFRMDADGRLTEIGARAQSLDQIQGQYMGLLKFTHQGWRRISEYLTTLSPEKRDRLDVTAMLSGLLDSGVAINAIPTSEKWFEIDILRDYELCQAYFEHHSLPL